MGPPGEIINALILAGAFILILGLSELIHHFFYGDERLHTRFW